MEFAVAFFRHRLGSREWTGALLIVGGAAVVSYRSGEITADWIGIFAVAGASLMLEKATVAGATSLVVTI